MGSLVDGEFKYVGSVTQGIAPEIQEQLLQRLPTLKRKTAVIQCPREAVWVKPEIGCRATFKSWTDDKLMQEAAVKELVVESNEKK
jgi:ATP-dependent DNA ligase